MKRVKLKNHRFYVYEYWRPDKDLCFYVGKGEGQRAYVSKRGRYFNNVMKKLSRLGLTAEVRIVKGGLLENEAHSLEVERIAFWRNSGVPLSNQTNGGEGISGYRRTEDEKRRIGLGNKGKIHSEEQNKNHSKTMKGRKISAEHQAALIASNTGRSPPEHVRIKISLSNKGQKRSEETCIKLSISHRGKKHPVETKMKMKQAHKKRWAVMTKAERKQHSENTKKGQVNYTKERRGLLVKERMKDPEFGKKFSASVKRGWVKRRLNQTNLMGGG